MKRVAAGAQFRVRSGQVRCGSIRQSSASPRPSCLCLAITQADARPVMAVSFIKDLPDAMRAPPQHGPAPQNRGAGLANIPTSGIMCMESRHMPIELSYDDPILCR